MQSVDGLKIKKRFQGPGTTLIKYHYKREFANVDYESAKEDIERGVKLLEYDGISVVFHIGKCLMGRLPIGNFGFPVAWILADSG